MKKVLLLITILFVAILLPAQDITNTLSSGGTYKINENNGSTLVAVKEGNNLKPLVGIGTGVTVANSTLQVDGSFSVAAKILQDADFSGDAYSVTEADHTLIVWNTVSNDVTINLPDPSTMYGRVYIVKNNSTHIVTVDAGSGKAIDAAQTNALNTQYQYIVIQAASSGYWAIIGGN